MTFMAGMLEDRNLLGICRSPYLDQQPFPCTASNLLEASGNVKNVCP